MICDLDIGDHVDYTAHAVARNEYRTLFPLTSIAKGIYYQNKALAFAFGQLGVNAFDPEEFYNIKSLKFEEKPFDGSHSDIGGGYKDYRNLAALRWMIKKGQSRGAPFSDLEKYPHYEQYLKNNDMKVPHKSHRAAPFFITDFFEGDRVIFPGNM